MYLVRTCLFLRNASQLDKWAVMSMLNSTPQHNWTPHNHWRWHGATKACVLTKSFKGHIQQVMVHASWWFVFLVKVYCKLFYPHCKLFPFSISGQLWGAWRAGKCCKSLQVMGGSTLSTPELCVVSSRLAPCLLCFCVTQCQVLHTCKHKLVPAMSTILKTKLFKSRYFERFILYYSR